MPATAAASTNGNRRLRERVDIERRETVGGTRRTAAHTGLVCSGRTQGSQLVGYVYPSTGADRENVDELAEDDCLRLDSVEAPMCTYGDLLGESFGRLTSQAFGIAVAVE